METPEKPTFEGWAILELMGHRRLAGMITEATIAGSSFIRIDCPPANESDQLVTQYYSPSSVYCITPTSEEIVLMTAASINGTRPVHPWEIRRLPVPPQSDDENDD